MSEANLWLRSFLPALTLHCGGHEAHPAVLGSTVTLQLVEVRKTQSLFRRKLVSIEKECRMTGIRDLRFLRASHIKPWSECKDGAERIDGHNGLLLAPHADLLFDRGCISFENGGQLLVAGDMPADVKSGSVSI